MIRKNPSDYNLQQRFQYFFDEKLISTLTSLSVRARVGEECEEIYLNHIYFQEKHLGTYNLVRHYTFLNRDILRMNRTLYIENIALLHQVDDNTW